MADAIFNRSNTLEGPAWNAAAVTAANADLARIPTTGIWVGGAGNLTVQMAGGGTVTFTGVPAGTLLPIRVDRVNSTGTTATAIVALYND